MAGGPESGVNAGSFIPFIILLLGVVNALLGIIYRNLVKDFESTKRANEAAIAKLSDDLLRQSQRFDNFRDREIQAFRDRMDNMQQALTNSIHDLRLHLGENYVRRADLPRP